MHPKRTIQRDLRHDLELAARFWSKVDRPFGLDCWIWIGANDGQQGYGHIGVDGHLHKSHRVAWLLTRGPIPDGKRVLHRCDNPPCVRPNHLYVDTMSANMREMWRKGRQNRVGIKGVASNLAKLGVDDVLAIRALAAQGVSRDNLAAQFNVTPGCVWQIVKRKTWAHI